jgi:hypothetical protein
MTLTTVHGRQVSEATELEFNNKDPGIASAIAQGRHVVVHALGGWHLVQIHADGHWSMCPFLTVFRFGEAGRQYPRSDVVTTVDVEPFDYLDTAFNPNPPVATVYRHEILKDIPEYEGLRKFTGSKAFIVDDVRNMLDDGNGVPPSVFLVTR